MLTTDQAGPSAAEIRRFAEALRAIDLGALPSGSMARDLHLTVAALAETDVGARDLTAFVGLLARLYGALAAVDAASLAETSPRELVELIVGVDDAKALLEMPDLSRVPSGELASWFRELYCAIMRLRATSCRLHRVWTATAPVREVP
jgi:hypothetical protein